MSLSQRRTLIDQAAAGSIRQQCQCQCQWLGLHRSAYYYQPLPASEEDLKLMRLLDEQYLLTPQSSIWLPKDAISLARSGLRSEP